jgi:hypothetical protein
MTMRKKSRAAPGDSYRRGYSNGVVAAVDALLDDLAEAGRLDDVEYDEDGRSLTCKGCTIRYQGFDRLADRFDYATGNIDKAHRGTR